MEVEAQRELIRSFMLAIAPQVTFHSLENGINMSENAALILESSMQLAARYNELCETLTATPQDPAQTNKPKTRASTAGVHKTQARVSIKKSDVPDLQRPSSGRPSPMDPSWKPPDPYV